MPSKASTSLPASACSGILVVLLEAHEVCSELAVLQAVQWVSVSVPNASADMKSTGLNAATAALAATAVALQLQLPHAQPISVWPASIHTVLDLELHRVMDSLPDFSFSVVVESDQHVHCPPTTNLSLMLCRMSFRISSTL